MAILVRFLRLVGVLLVAVVLVLMLFLLQLHKVEVVREGVKAVGTLCVDEPLARVYFRQAGGLSRLQRLIAGGTEQQELTDRRLVRHCGVSLVVQGDRDVAVGQHAGPDLLRDVGRLRPQHAPAVRGRARSREVL